MNISALSAGRHLSLMSRIYLCLKASDVLVVAVRILADCCLCPISRKNFLINQERHVVAEKNAVKNRRAQVKAIVVGAKHSDDISEYGAN